VEFDDYLGLNLTNGSLLCYNSFTEQGQMFWVTALFAALPGMSEAVFMVSNGAHKPRNSGIWTGKRFTAASRLTSGKASKHAGFRLT
jgi:hypothetical protein